MSISVLVEEELKAIKRIEEAKRKAARIIEEAKKKAEEIKDKNKIMSRANEYLQQKEIELRKEAEEIKQEYVKQAEKIRSIPPEKIEEIADKIIKEVIGIER